ncbi:MAG: hypothetical protein ACLGI6_01855 [Gammaproteobacteria bacterium]
MLIALGIVLMVGFGLCGMMGLGFGIRGFGGSRGTASALNMLTLLGTLGIVVAALLGRLVVRACRKLAAQRAAARSD